MLSRDTEAIASVYISVYKFSMKRHVEYGGFAMPRDRQRGIFSDLQIAEEWLEEKVKPLYLPLWQMIHEPFVDLLESRGEDRRFRILTEGECAQWLRPQIIEKAREVFASFPEIKIEKMHNQTFVRVGDELAIVPKKLKPSWKGRGLTFSSYSTDKTRGTGAKRK